MEWQTHYAEEYGLTSNSLPAMLGVIGDGIGSFTLEHLASRPELIERWLNRMQKERSWTENNWNRYYELLHSLFNRAIKWKRLKVNPVASIDKKVGAKKKFEVRIEESIEDRLLAACEKLNRPTARSAQQAPYMGNSRRDTQQSGCGGEAEARSGRLPNLKRTLLPDRQGRDLESGEISNRYKGRRDETLSLCRVRSWPPCQRDTESAIEAHRFQTG